MMDCKQIESLLVDYLYQELDVSQVEHFEAHLKACSRCASEVSAFESTRTMMRDLPELEPPARLMDQLIEEATRAVQPPAAGFWERLREGLRLMVLHPAMTAAVTLVLVFGVSFYVYQRGSPPHKRTEPELPLATEIDRRPAGESATISLRERASVATPAADERGFEETPGGGKSAEKAMERAGGAGLRPNEDKLHRPKEGALGALAGLGTEDDRPGPVRRSKRALDEANYTPALKPTTLAKSPPAARPAPNAFRDEEVLDRVSSGKNQRGPVDAPVATAQPAPPPAPQEVNVWKKEAAPAKSRGYSSLSSPATSVSKGLTAPQPTANRTLQGQTALQQTAAGRAPQGRQDQESSLAGRRGRAPRPAKSRQAAPRQRQQATPATAAQWLALADTLSQAGRCHEALEHYSRALELEPKLLATITGKLRRCASVLAAAGESQVFQAQRAHPRLSGVFAMEVRKARARLKMDAESTQRAQRASKARQGKSQTGRAETKAKAKPAAADAYSH